MTSAELECLAKAGHLKPEPPAAGEIEALRRSGALRLGDSRTPGLSPESRFDLAYNGAHALALAGLRLQGYRSDSRYLVFQPLPHTLGIPAPTWRVLAKCHEIRNRAEYEGSLEIDARLVDDLTTAAEAVHSALAAVLGTGTP